MTTVSSIKQTSYQYFSGYTPNRHQSIDAIIADFEMRTAVLNRYFNIGMHFDTDWLVRANGICPAWVEKFFPSFEWQMIALTYGEAVSIMLAKLSEARDGRMGEYSKGRFGPGYLQQLAKSEQMFQRLGENQKSDEIIATPAQFGLRYRDFSICRAREAMDAQEFGLGVFAGGIMLLTHPERLMNSDDLFIDFAGDGYVPEFSVVPTICFGDDRLQLGAAWSGGAHDQYGSPSGFLLQ